MAKVDMLMMMMMVTGTRNVDTKRAFGVIQQSKDAGLDIIICK
jgi:hypothetical protein